MLFILLETKSLNFFFGLQYICSVPNQTVLAILCAIPDEIIQDTLF